MKTLHDFYLAHPTPCGLALLLALFGGALLMSHLTNRSAR